MKTHAIIPIFVPHAGCPHDCIFCDQKAITARTEAPDEAAVRETVNKLLSTIDANPHITHREIAFYGGSFTGIPRDRMLMYLAIAKEYKSSGRIDAIHLSTRPDYIDDSILDDLEFAGVDTIELGVQSFDPEVLDLSARGHDVETVYRSSELIKSRGFNLGIQLMIGLPGDSYEKCMDSVRQTIAIGPSIARIYPTVIISGTGLDRAYRNGTYRALPEDEAVNTAKDMYLALTAAGINVIRIGLKATDNMKEEGGSAVAGFHPAFRQLVESAIARDELEAQIPGIINTESLSSLNDLTCGADGSTSSRNVRRRPDMLRLTALSSPESFSSMIGNKRSNRIYFAEKYPLLDIKFSISRELPRGRYILKRSDS